MAASPTPVMAAHSAAKHTGNGGGKADASAGGNGAFDAVFATLMAARTANAGGQTADASTADASTGVQTDGAGHTADKTSPAAQQLLQALNASASSAALASADATSQAPAAKTKSDAGSKTAKDASKDGKDKAQIHVPPNVIAKASETAKAHAPALQQATNGTEQGTDKKTAKTSGNTDHAGKSKKNHKSAADQSSAALLTALGVSAGQTQPAAPQNTTKTGQDIVGDATASKSNAAAGTSDAATQTAATATPGSAADPQAATKAPAADTATPKPGAQHEAASAATTTSAQTTAAETALKDVLAALGAKSAAASKASAAQDSAGNTAKPAQPGATANHAGLASAAAKSGQNNGQASQSTATAAAGQAVATANGGNNAASDKAGHDNGAPAHHAPDGNGASAKSSPQAAQAGFQLPQHGATATATNAPDPTAATPFAAQAATNGVSGHVTAQLHVAAQAAAQAQQAVPAHDFGALALNIAAHSKNGAQHFSIALHPADLGHIHVQLSVDHSGAAQAHLSAENQQTLQLLQQNGHHLERALKESGLNLAGGGLNFSLKGQQQQNTGGQSGQGRSRTLSVSAVASSAGATETAATAPYDLAPGSVRLDIKV